VINGCSRVGSFILFSFASDNRCEPITYKNYSGGRSTLLLLVLSIAFLFIAPLINVLLSKKDSIAVGQQLSDHGNIVGFGDQYCLCRFSTH
jgi:hypothetical protein